MDGSKPGSASENRYQGTAIEATEYASVTLRNAVDDTPGYVWA